MLNYAQEERLPSSFLRTLSFTREEQPGGQ